MEREAATSATSEPFVLGPQTSVAEVLERYPRALEIFLRHGFAPLQNPVLRRTMARVVTLEQACRREGADVNRLLAELNALIEAEREARVRSSEAGEAFSV
jgi:iron-sulfur cluster repair protein YtfE (RIC family)